MHHFHSCFATCSSIFDLANKPIFDQRLTNIWPNAWPRKIYLLTMTKVMFTVVFFNWLEFGHTRQQICDFGYVGQKLVVEDWKLSYIDDPGNWSHFGHVFREIVNWSRFCPRGAYPTPRPTFPVRCFRRSARLPTRHSEYHFIIIAFGLGNYATIIRLFLLFHFLPSGGTRYSSGAICSWGEWEHLNMRPPYFMDSLPLAIIYILLGCWHLCYTNYILLGYRYFYRVKSSLDNGTYATFI